MREEPRHVIQHYGKVTLFTAITEYPISDSFGKVTVDSYNSRLAWGAGEGLPMHHWFDGYLGGNVWEECGGRLGCFLLPSFTPTLVLKVAHWSKNRELGIKSKSLKYIKDVYKWFGFKLFFFFNQQMPCLQTALIVQIPGIWQMSPSSLPCLQPRFRFERQYFSSANPPLKASSQICSPDKWSIIAPVYQLHYWISVRHTLPLGSTHAKQVNFRLLSI